MKQILNIIAGGLIAVSCLGATPAFATEDKTIEPRESATHEAVTTSEVTKIEPTFIVEDDEDDQSLRLWVGRNLLLAGNNFVSEADVTNGLMLMAGNSLSLRTNSEYGFVFGNTIDFSGATEKDLYMAGNIVTIESDAKIGRDVFVASDTLHVRTDLSGSLAATVARITLKDVTIAGNLDLSANRIEFEGDVIVKGRLTYNDDADVTGLSNVTAGESETYHLAEATPQSILLSRIYSKVMSMAGLFLIMALICAVYKSLHTKIEQQATASRFGTNLAIGLGVLIAIPVLALLAFFTIVAAPLGVIALLFYAILIYLSQGFAGAWVGHIIIEKLCKIQANVYLEVLVGIIVLGLLSLVPFVGVATGFIGMLLGIGLIIAHVRPQTSEPARSGRKVAAKSKSTRSKKA